MANTTQIMPDIYERLRELLAHLPDTLPEWPKRDFQQCEPGAQEIKFNENATVPPVVLYNSCVGPDIIMVRTGPSVGY